MDVRPDAVRFTVEFKFKVGDVVQYSTFPGEQPNRSAAFWGQVVGVRLIGNNRAYRVVYWLSSVRTESWFNGDELELRP